MMTASSYLEDDAKLIYSVVQRRIRKPSPPWEQLPECLKDGYREAVEALFIEVDGPRCEECGKKLKCPICKNEPHAH